MSDQETTNSLIGEIKDLFHFLTEKEPTPDDEIEGQKEFIDKFKKLRDMNALPDQQTQIDNILEKLEEWDTLEQWFIETPIPGEIRKLLNIRESIEEQKSVEIESKTVGVNLEEKILKIPEEKTSNIDISEIVSQVSAQFKGEIDNLKDKINSLKSELDNKEEEIKESKKQKPVMKPFPKKGSKLPPLTIKIPVIKKPSSSSSKDLSKVKSSGKTRLAPIPQERPKQEQKILEAIPTSPKVPIQEENKVEKKLTPIPQKQQQEITKPELSIQPQQEKVVKQEFSNTTEDVKKVEQGLVLFGTSNKDVNNPTPPPKKRSLITTMAMEEPLNRDKPKKEPKKEQKKTAHITQVKVEEIETQKTKPAGTELFNVFSPHMEEQKTSKKKKKKTSDSGDLLFSKEKGKQQQKIAMEQEPQTTTYSSNIINTEINQINIEDLPKDKDSLYQELIALEGKRYSLEKEFKEFEKRYEKGSINENSFKNQTIQLKSKLDEITIRITGIRRIISSL